MEMASEIAIARHFYNQLKVKSHLILENLARKKTGSDTVTSAYTKIYGYERPHVSGYTAYTEISTLESVYGNLRIHRAYTADTCGR